MSANAFSRRDFLRASATASAALTIAIWLDGCGRGEPAAGGAPSAAGPDGRFAPNAFLQVDPKGGITVIAKHLEMGQGAFTGLATLIAEEMDADWAKVRVVGAPADASKYANLNWGGAQGTGGSDAMANSYEQMRKAGATARAMLVAAAAQVWDVPAAEITVERGIVKHAGKRLASSFGELVRVAATLPVPAEVTLKDPARFTLVGKDDLPRADVREKVDGSARFTQDVALEGMLTAVVLHPPRFGATARRVDAERARAVPGVLHVVQVPTGVAVVATGFWAAKQGRDALVVDWDLSRAEGRGTAALRDEFRALLAKPGLPARRDGDAEAGLRGAARTVEATYEVPFLAHATMEPMNCVVQLGRDRCELWYGAQSHTADQVAIAALLGLKPEQVTINTLYAGGSFGRRAAKASDYVLEAVEVARAIGGNAPVKLVWTREDDMAAGNYRPMFLHAVRGGLDAAGKPVAWHHRVVGQSVLSGTPFEGFAVKDGIDGASVEGITNLAYAMPAIACELHTPKVGVPVQWWRSVGHTHTAFAVESFIDELAHAAGQDPVAWRLALLEGKPRHLAVLKLAAEKAGWGSKLPAGRARGVAVHESFNSVVAEVAEVSVTRGVPRVHRVVCAVDCGIAINPDVIRAQMEGGIAYGLSAALHGAVTLEDGVVQERNFDRYRCLRLDEMPQVEVHIVPSTAAPTGVGEPGLPPIAPAVANALFALTGTRVRTLPIRLA